jgi:hypothetical protein
VSEPLAYRGAASRNVRFSTQKPDDPIWGIGLDCEGASHIWLQPVTPENGYAPRVYLNACLQDRPGCVSTVIGREALAGELGRCCCPYRSSCRLVRLITVLR